MKIYRNDDTDSPYSSMDDNRLKEKNECIPNCIERAKRMSLSIDQLAHIVCVFT